MPKGKDRNAYEGPLDHLTINSHEGTTLSTLRLNVVITKNPGKHCLFLHYITKRTPEEKLYVATELRRYVSTLEPSALSTSVRDSFEQFISALAPYIPFSPTFPRFLSSSPQLPLLCWCSVAAGQASGAQAAPLAAPHTAQASAQAAPWVEKGPAQVHGEPAAPTAHMVMRHVAVP